MYKNVCKSNAKILCMFYMRGNGPIHAVTHLMKDNSVDIIWYYKTQIGGGRYVVSMGIIT